MIDALERERERESERERERERERTSSTGIWPDAHLALALKAAQAAPVTRLSSKGVLECTSAMRIASPLPYRSK